jgi:predicted ATPase
VAATRSAAEECRRVATEHAFPFWLAAARIMRARAAFDEGGDREQALQEMDEGLRAWFATGARISGPYFRTLIADALLDAQRFEDARKTMTQALADADHDREHWWLAEHYRLNAEILRRESIVRGEAVHPDAEMWVQKALATARDQRATSLELRAAMTRSQLRASLGTDTDGVDLLREVHARFTEGFETADLKAAAMLLT